MKKGTPAVPLARLASWKRLQGIPPEHLVFLDESGVHLAFIRKCARALSGQRVYAAKPHRKGQNVSVIGAMSLNGRVTPWRALGAVEALTFDAFMAPKLVPQLWPGAVVIMDNGLMHKSAELAALSMATGARLIYSPPYAPDFLPIQNDLRAFSVALVQEPSLLCSQRWLMPLQQSQHRIG